MNNSLKKNSIKILILTMSFLVTSISFMSAALAGDIQVPQKLYLTDDCLFAGGGEEQQEICAGDLNSNFALVSIARGTFPRVKLSTEDRQKVVENVLRYVSSGSLVHYCSAPMKDWTSTGYGYRVFYVDCLKDLRPTAGNSAGEQTSDNLPLWCPSNYVSPVVIDKYGEQVVTGGSTGCYPAP